jgi:hypothetical protein
MEQDVARACVFRPVKSGCCILLRRQAPWLTNSTLGDDAGRFCWDHHVWSWRAPRNASFLWLRLPKFTAILCPSADRGYWGNVNPVGVRSVYDEAKRFAEAMTMAVPQTRGLDTRSSGFFNTYGPRMRMNDGRAIPNFISQALLGNPSRSTGRNPDALLLLRLGPR